MDLATCKFPSFCQGLSVPPHFSFQGNIQGVYTRAKGLLIYWDYSMPLLDFAKGECMIAIRIKKAARELAANTTVQSTWSNLLSAEMASDHRKC